MKKTIRKITGRILSSAGIMPKYKMVSTLLKHRSLRREIIACLYVKGDGIEIGPFANPLETYGLANVKYVDRMPLSELRTLYPEMKDVELANIDIVDDGEKLGTLGDGTQDFVIANHFIEHTINPIGALENMLRVLKPGGILFFAVPDMRKTFDNRRTPTPAEHLVRDFADGDAAAVEPHFLDFAEKVEGLSCEEEIRRRARELMDNEHGVHFHFHCWRPVDMMGLLHKLNIELKFPFDVEHFGASGQEMIIVLRKTSN